VRSHPVLEDQQPGSCREFNVLAHVEMSEYEIVHMPFFGKILGELVQRLIGPSERIFLALRHTALL